MREVAPYIGQIAPVRSPGDPIPVHQRDQRIPAPFGKLENGRLADHPHNPSLQNVNLSVKEHECPIRLGEVVGKHGYVGATALLSQLEVPVSLTAAPRVSFVRIHFLDHAEFHAAGGPEAVEVQLERGLKVLGGFVLENNAVVEQAMAQSVLGRSLFACWGGALEAAASGAGGKDRRKEDIKVSSSLRGYNGGKRDWAGLGRRAFVCNRKTFEML